MPRLNIYIPDDLDLALRSFPGEINISRVCAAALRAQLNAKADDRSAGMLFHSLFDRPNWISQIVLQRYTGLTWVIAMEPMYEGEEHADIVAENSSHFLDRTMVDGCQLGLGGGEHMWNVVRRLEARNIGMHLWALGCGHVDPELPHVHPNALVTLLSVLFSPRSKAHLVGAEKLDHAWKCRRSTPTISTT